MSLGPLVPARTMQTLLRPAEVARMLGVSRTWLYDVAKDGRIPSVRIGGPGGPMRCVAEDLERWLSEARGQMGATARRFSERDHSRQPA